MEDKDQSYETLERVNQEGKELAEKIQKLHDFIDSNPAFNELDELSKHLLTTQLNTMNAYFHILVIRANTWKHNNAE